MNKSIFALLALVAVAGYAQDSTDSGSDVAVEVDVVKDVEGSEASE